MVWQGHPGRTTSGEVASRSSSTDQAEVVLEVGVEVDGRHRKVLVLLSSKASQEEQTVQQPSLATPSPTSFFFVIAPTVVALSRVVRTPSG